MGTVSRRTGTTIEIGKRKFQNGVESYEDCWTNRDINSFSSANEVQEGYLLIQPIVCLEKLNYNNLNKDLSHLIENSPVMHIPIINQQNSAISPLSTAARDFRKSLHKTTSFTGIENLPSSAYKTTACKAPSTNCLQSNINPIVSNFQKNQSTPVSGNISTISNKTISNDMDLNSCVTGSEDIYEGEEIAASSVDTIENKEADPENLINSASPVKTEFDKDKSVPDTASKSSQKNQPKSAKKKRKISETIASSEAEVQLRRSKRNKIPPLEYWRNERLIYKWNGSELLDIKYDAGTAEDNTAVNSILKRMKKSNKPSGHQKNKAKLLGGSKLLDNSVNAAKVQETLPLKFQL